MSPISTASQQDRRALIKAMDGVPVGERRSIVEQALPRGDVVDPDTEGPAVLSYLQGLLSLSLNDREGARRALARMTADTGGAPDLILLLSSSLRARLVAAEGRPQDAIVLLGQPTVRPWAAAVAYGVPYYEGGMDRFLLATLLAEEGRADEAERWFRSAALGSPFNILYSVANRRRAEGVGRP